MKDVIGIDHEHPGCLRRGESGVAGAAQSAVVLAKDRDALAFETLQQKQTCLVC